MKNLMSTILPPGHKTLLLLRGRWRLLFGQCPACKHGWPDPEKQCGICGDHEKKPDRLRKRCWWLAYKFHVQTLK